MGAVALQPKQNFLFLKYRAENLKFTEFNLLSSFSLKLFTTERLSYAFGVEFEDVPIISHFP